MEVLEFCSFGIETATALCHTDGMICWAQIILLGVRRSFNTLEQILLNLYSILFRPGTNADHLPYLSKFGGWHIKQDWWFWKLKYIALWARKLHSEATLETSRVPLVFSFRRPCALCNRFLKKFPLFFSLPLLSSDVPCPRRLASHPWSLSEDFQIVFFSAFLHHTCWECVRGQKKKGPQFIFALGRPSLLI